MSQSECTSQEVKLGSGKSACADPYFRAALGFAGVWRLDDDRYDSDPIG